MRFLDKLKGAGQPLPPRLGAARIGLIGLGAGIAIGTLMLAANLFNATLLLASFGASAALVFGYPESPLAQPRNVVLGHVIGSSAGLLCLHLFGTGPGPAALAVGGGLAVMLMLRCPHPPACSNPLIVMLLQPGWGFVLWPTLTGTVLLVVLGMLYNNAARAHHYPRYW